MRIGQSWRRIVAVLGLLGGLASLGVRAADNGPEGLAPPPVLPDPLRPDEPTPCPPTHLPPLDSLLAAPGSAGWWSLDQDRGRKVTRSSGESWGPLSGNLQVVDLDANARWEDPLGKRTWQANQSLSCPVVGPVSLFGQLGAGSEEAGLTDMKVTGRTGLACKAPLVLGAEVELRSGPGITYSDPLRPEKMQEKSDWLVELQARAPLILGLGLEYQWTALPSLTLLGQDVVTQDLRVAMPVGSAGKFELGARQRWALTPDQKTAPDSMQLYLGLKLTH